jgi:heme A synthase
MTSARMAAVAIVVVAIGTAILVARQFDSPTSTFLLLGISLAGLALGGVFGRTPRK